MAIVATYPSIPFLYNMGSISPGKMIFISGFVLPNANQFHVDFENKPWGTDIAFTCVFRLIPKEDHNVIVLNSLTNNTWGPEERITEDFPLAPKDFFEMTINVEQEGFKVSVNNKSHLTYSHRLKPLSQFTHLRIGGDVILKEVRCQ
ncbi:galectin-9-like isoform X2 [Dreissena polymorpha]|uniref:galectin-9-like isoform X2 n=1 Tax=Dreissena polymorpha TaxID=45954 RepID=UPI002264455E|nr:galectin-9-like isoform X2 [Dreissena polymorpha]